MPAAAAKPVEDDGPAPAPEQPKGKRKLIVLVASALLVVTLAGGGAAALIVKKRAADAAAAALDEGYDEEAGPAPAARRDIKAGPPAFLPLDPFVVNLADADSSRYAQIGITLELRDAKSAEELKAYMPAIRNGVLMVLAHKMSSELLTRPGKERLAAEVMREAVRPLGIELAGDAPDPAAGARPRGLATTPIDDSPVRHVHFSSFIIQ
ncbi:MAG TPA: flagellar basal body-associated FliL family protein [Albitalea sp.]